MKKYIISVLLLLSVALCFGEAKTVVDTFIFEPGTSLDEVLNRLQNNTNKKMNYHKVDDVAILIEMDVSDSEVYTVFNYYLRFTNYFLSAQIVTVKFVKEVQEAPYIMEIINDEIEKFNLKLENMYTVKAHPCISLKSPDYPNYIVTFEYNEAKWELYRSIYDLELSFQ